MRFLALLPTVSLINDNFSQGSLQIPHPTNPLRLGFNGTRIVRNDHLQFFGYYDTNAFLLVEGGLFLSVDCRGQLVLDTFPHDGFRLVDDNFSFWQKHLTYKNSAKFQLCADNSIGFRSVCEGAQEISISYEVDWPVEISAVRK